MALIKCVECGKEFSDKASACIHCGCPLEESKKYFCEECGKEIYLKDEMCKNCGCPISINNNKVVKKSNSSTRNDEEYEVARIIIDEDRLNKFNRINLFLAIVLTITIIPGIYLWLYYFYIKGCRNNELVLTNKRIKGKIRMFLNTTRIDIPLDKIESIHTDEIFKMQSIVIRSGGAAKSALFSLNGEEFCQKAIEEMENYKYSVYNR